MKNAILCAVYITNIRFACNVIIIIMIWWKMLILSFYFPSRPAQPPSFSIYLSVPSRELPSKQINNVYLFKCFF